MDRLILPSSPTDRTFTSISWPTLRCSLISSTYSSATSLLCTSPVFPPGNSTNAPKFLIPLTFPITLLPTSTDILIYYPPNYHLLSLYNNTIKKKNNHYNIVTIILPELLFQHFHRSISAN